MNEEKSPIRVGVVGTNFISEWFCRAAEATPGVRVTAVYSRKQETGAAFAEKCGLSKVCTDFSGMLRDPEIDGVYIASPILCHAEQAVAALAAGKHVLCEKMIAADGEEFLRMQAAAERSGCVLMEAMRPAFDPAIGVLREAMGRIGKIRSADLHFCQYSSRYDAFRRGEVLNAFDPGMKNSALADIGIYPLHLAVSLFGEPTALSASSVSLSNGFEGAGQILLGYPDFCVSVGYAKIFDDPRPSAVLGEEGMITLDKVSAPGEILLTLRGKAPERLPLPELPRLPDGSVAPMHGTSYANMTYEIAAFRDAIRGEYPHRKNLALTAAVMRTVEKIRACQV